MSNPTNWPIVTDADTYLRHQEKRVLSEQRRPIVGHGNILGPGFAPNASEIDDWNDDAAATNGYFWTPQGASNAPATNLNAPYGDGVDPSPDSLWLGQTISRGDVGYQSARLLSNVFDADEPAWPEIEVHRQWKTVASGMRAYGPWRGNPIRPVRLYDISYVGTGSTDLVGFLGDPDLPVFTDIYTPGEDGVWMVHIAITVANTSDSTTTRSCRFWPALDGSAAAPDINVGDYGWWQHDGSGTAGFSETETAARSFFIYPTAGSHTIQIALLATSGLTVPQVDLYAFQVQ